MRFQSTFLYDITWPHIIASLIYLSQPGISNFTANSAKHVSFFHQTWPVVFQAAPWWRSIKPSPLLRADRGRCIRMARGSAGQAFNTGPLAMARKASSLQLVKGCCTKSFWCGGITTKKTMRQSRWELSYHYKTWFAFQPSTKTQ